MLHRGFFHLSHISFLKSNKAPLYAFINLYRSLPLVTKGLYILFSKAAHTILFYFFWCSFNIKIIRFHYLENQLCMTITIWVFPILKISNLVYCPSNEYFKLNSLHPFFWLIQAYHLNHHHTILKFIKKFIDV